LSGFVRTLTLLSTSILLLALTVTVAKYILFDLARGQFMRQIEDYFKARQVPAKTDDIIKFLEGQKVEIERPIRWFKRQKASQWLVSAMLGITIILFVITLISYNCT